MNKTLYNRKQLSTSLDGHADQVYQNKFYNKK